jgi:4-oxalocrotonate tautomerase
MPIIDIVVTDEGVSNDQKKALIKGATDLVVDILDKDPDSTFVLIREISTLDWGFKGVQVEELRRARD